LIHYIYTIYKYIDHIYIFIYLFILYIYDMDDATLRHAT
jgi:hypothetical protein